ncbi:hypothetical protein ABZW18_28705 [Streptomyces sp. NPDC004647]|uniref:hypothetical protein n=1 Tax=Streptomyces sp. NPDC004647 TaxID=3154671 RepID=UPI0033B7C0D2
MPLPTPSRPPSGPRRRSLLAGALGATTTVGLLAGCSGQGSEAERAEAAERSSEAKKLRERSARDSRALLVHYDATVEAHPGLAEQLRPMRGAVAQHEQAFLTPRRPSPSPSGSSSESSSQSSSPSAAPSRSAGPPPSVPRDQQAALSALAGAERRTADARTAALLDAPPELARLLASVAAAGAAHAYLLTEGG